VSIDSPRISVVLAVRDGAAYLAEAVDSILAQTLRDFELVVVDDGSTDATPSILAEFGRRDPRVVVVRQEPGGLAAALNRGVRQARAVYVARMDADDIAYPQRLESQVSFLDGDEAALVGTAWHEVDSGGRRLRTVVPPTRHDELVRVLARRNPFCHPTVVFRREAWRAVGGYRSAFAPGAEDYDLWLRLAEHYRLACLPQPLLDYRLHFGNLSARTVRRQVEATYAARAAAARRAAGDEDGLDGDVVLTAQRLAALGIDARDVDLDVANTALNWAAKAWASGEATAALGLADDGLVAARAARARPVVARAERIRAAALARSGRPVAALRAACRAISADARLPAWLLARALRAGRGRVAARSRRRAARGTRRAPRPPSAPR
jgi:hypothetical protein